jgi:glycosyltransferase involved in cell wall biosynthesis
MISVAMCTYNGSKHIKEQLESIIYQTRKPDEIIICDDCSSDNTVEIAQNLLSVSTIKSTIIRNEINLGFRKNFEKAIGLCHGDIVFLSDQDDVWLPEKIEKVANIFDNDEEVIMAFHDAYNGPLVKTTF